MEFLCGGSQLIELGDDILVCFFFVGFEREDVVGPRRLDEAGDLGVTAHGVDGDGGSAELEFGKESRQGGQFVAFLFADFVPHAQARLADPRSQDVQGAFARGGVLGSTADFAVDSDLFAIQIADPQLHDFE